MRALSTRTFVLLLLAGLALQVSLLAFRGTRDVLTFKVWAAQSHERGLFNTYRSPPRDDNWLRPDYPPAALIFLNAAAALGTWVGAETDSRLLTVIIKTPMLVVRALLAFGLFLFVKRRYDTDTARRAALSIWINPAIVINGPALGYLDTLCWSTGLASLVLASTGRNALAGAAAALSCLIKPQGLFFGAVLGVMSIGRREVFLRIGAVAGAVLAAAFAPFVAVSGWLAVWRGLNVNFSEGMLSGHALNVWWLVTAVVRMWQYGLRDYEAPTILRDAAIQQATGVHIQPWTVPAIIVVALTIAWSVHRYWTVTHLSAAAALIVHTYFVLAVSVHENHLVYAVPPLVLVSIARPYYRRLFWTVSAFAAINMLLFYGLGRDFPRPERVGLFLPATAVLSAVSVMLLAWHARLFRRLREDGATTTGPVPPLQPGLLRTRAR